MRQPAERIHYIHDSVVSFYILVRYANFNISAGATNRSWCEIYSFKSRCKQALKLNMSASLFYM